MVEPGHSAAANPLPPDLAEPKVAAFGMIPGLKELPPLPPPPLSGRDDTVNAANHEQPVESEVVDYGTFGLARKPKEESLWGYQYTLKYQDDLQFFPQNYGFDEIVVKGAGVDSAGNLTHEAFLPRHRHYYEFAPLRRNLAILRNYLMVHYPYEGPVAVQNKARLEQMARELGHALSSNVPAVIFIDRWWKRYLRMLLGIQLPRQFTARFSDYANIPDRGIAYMYEFLLRRQEGLPPIYAPHTPRTVPRDWKMLPLAQTPFSDDNMQRYSRSSRMGTIANALEIVAEQIESLDELQLRPVHEMSQQQKDLAVKIARDILKNMRILTHGNDEQRVDVEDPRVHEASLALQATVAYRDALADMVQSDPNMINDPDVREAGNAVKKISNRVREEEREMYHEEARPAAAGAADRRVNRSIAKQRPKETMNQLLQKIDAGLSRYEKMERKLGNPRARQQQQGVGRDVRPQQGLVMRGVRNELDSTMSGTKVTQVSRTELVDAAKKANETDQTLQHPDKSSSDRER